MLERQDLPCTCLAIPELESISMLVIASARALTWRHAPYTRTSRLLLNLLLSSTSRTRALYCSLSCPMLGDSRFTATSLSRHLAAYTLPKPPEPCMVNIHHGELLSALHRLSVLCSGLPFPPPFICDHPPLILGPRVQEAPPPQWPPPPF